MKKKIIIQNESELSYEEALRFASDSIGALEKQRRELGLDTVEGIVISTGEEYGFYTHPRTDKRIRR